MLKISIDLQPVLNVINAANVLYAPEKVEEANRQRDRLADRLLTVDLRLDRVFDAYLGLEKVRGY